MKAITNGDESKMNSDTLAKILNTLREANQYYNIALDGQKEAENCENDLRHELELQNPSYHERARIATELQKTLRERRQYKDMVEVLFPLANWYRENSVTIKALERVLGEMRRIEEKQANRQYVRRILKDEQCAGKR